MTGFAGFRAAEFLRDYWQRQPLLIRGAVPNFNNPLAPDELAGLALEDGSEARIVAQPDGHWEVDTGPFDDTSFDRDGPWTLLVQAVDHVVPRVAGLRKLVDFVPSWRLDDVMVSFASDGGGVGPHYDNYDVFLLQGLGRRRWRLGQRCDGSEALLPVEELRILEQFEPSADFLLEPGDVLYVPPRLAHWGIAEGPCMTYSLGFRAPAINTLLSRWLDTLLQSLDPELLYRDPEPGPAAAPGEIAHSSIDAALAQLRVAIQATPVGPDWFGEVVTEASGELVVPSTLQDLGGALRLRPAARLAWHSDSDTIKVYANGEALSAGLGQRALLEKLCSGEAVACPDEPAARALISRLAETGCLQDD